MAQLFEGVDALFVRLDDVNRDPHRVAEMDLTQVADVGFGREGRAAARVQIIDADPELAPDLVDRAVELEASRLTAPSRSGNCTAPARGAKPLPNDKIYGRTR